MTTKRRRKSDRLVILGWFEEYRCGCVSEITRFKKDLLGYCSRHGENRRLAWPETQEPETKPTP